MEKFKDNKPFYGDALARFRALEKSTGDCDQAHFRMWCKIAADEIELHRKRSDELLDLLTLSLPYVEEGEQFNKPAGKKLSKDIRGLISKYGE